MGDTVDQLIVHLFGAPEDGYTHEYGHQFCPGRETGRLF
jgi:hypothetical protein